MSRAVTHSTPARSVRLLTCALVAALGTPALADGDASAAPQVAVRAINLRGATEAGPYIAATAMRSAVMAACFGDGDFDQNPVAVEAFVSITKDGKVDSLSLQSARGFDVVVDTCLMEELNKARFPAAERRVEMSLLLSMGPLPDDKIDEDEGRR